MNSAAHSVISLRIDEWWSFRFCLTTDRRVWAQSVEQLVHCCGTGFVIGLWDFHSAAHSYVGHMLLPQVQREQDACVTVDLSRVQYDQTMTLHMYVMKVIRPRQL